jgi:hypothetical protein
VITLNDRAVFSEQLRNRRGRRARFEQSASVILRIRVTPAQKSELERVASDNQTDLSGAIRDAVDSYVSDYRDNAPVFRRT